MPLVLKENGVAVHVYFMDDARVIHCFDGDIESEIEVEIDVDTWLVAGYGSGNKLPTEDFQLEALLVVRRNRSQIVQAWKEISE